MIAELADNLLSWRSFLLVLLIFGFAPGLVLRFVVLAYRRDDPRRREQLAELHAVPWVERPLWVAGAIETALSEGLWERLVDAATGRIIYRWHLDSGITRNQQSPTSFWVPDPDEKAALEPGDLVKLLFNLRDGTEERMWVRVTDVNGDRFKGRLSNTPWLIPRLEPGDKIKFRADDIVDIDIDVDDAGCACSGGCDSSSTI